VRCRDGYARSIGSSPEGRSICVGTGGSIGAFGIFCPRRPRICRELELNQALRWRPVAMSPARRERQAAPDRSRLTNSVARPVISALRDDRAFA
jgi:hypothetical protein